MPRLRERSEGSQEGVARVVSHAFAVPAQIDAQHPSAARVARSARLALVTGAAAGLAKGIALRLAERGDRVVFTYRPGGTPRTETLALVRPHDPGVFAYPADFERREAAAEVIAAVEAER